MISRLLILASDLPAWDPYVQKIKSLEQKPEFLYCCKAGGRGLSIRLIIVILKNWQWPSKMFAHLKSCHRLLVLLKLDDIHMFHSTELVRLTWIWHPGRISKHTTATGVHKSCDYRTWSQCSVWCSLHDNASNTGPQISQASVFLHLLFPMCLNSETENTSFLIYRGKKMRLD